MNLKYQIVLVLIIVTLICLPVFKAVAQIEYGGEPIGFSKNKNSDAVKITMHTFTLSEEQQSQKKYYRDRGYIPGEAMHAGFSVEASLDPAFDGNWQTLGDSLHLWQIMIHAPQALGIGLVFNDFALNEHARIFTYDPSMTHIAGSFTEASNTESGVFSTRLIPGEKIIIEYQEKIQDGEQPAMANSSFMIKDLIYVWQGAVDLSDEKSLDSADECHVNINCPEGRLWQRQKRGVARMLMRVGSSYFWCSGSLINNTLRDGMPYFLSAAHCGDNANTDDLEAWQFYFNFERPECIDAGAPAHNVLVGAQVMAKGPLLGGSDFQLLLLNHPPPPQWQPFYSGWNRYDDPSAAGVGIHHPAGDAKKISTYTELAESAGPVVSGQQMAEHSTWRIIFSETETDHGVTQGGSSGSPMFNEQGLIVGTLTGGSSSCSNPSNPNFYGKISYHWDQSEDAFEHIQYFLDPIGTGEMEIYGFDPYREQYPAPGFVNVESATGDNVEVSWFKPLQTPNPPGWHAYAQSFSSQTSQGSQRATLFDESHLDFSFPVTVTRLSHVFVEGGSTWPNNEFRFKIYDQTGSNMVYESPVLEAESLDMNIYELEEPITFDTKFYVAVDPVHGTGNPASAYQLINAGNGVSFHGQPGNWTVTGSGSNQYVYLTKIFIDEHHQDENPSDKAAGNTNDEWIASENESLKWGNSVIFYRIYRNNALENIFDTSNNEPLVSIATSSPENVYDAFHVTAVYPEGIESAPSNTAYVFYEDFCDGVIADFPYEESFDNNELPVCWSAGAGFGGWQVAEEFAVADLVITPQHGESFAYLWQEEQEEGQNHWLVTPPYNLSEMEVAALTFGFNASFAAENDGLLRLYASIDGGSFHQIWSAKEHPEYRGSQAFTWQKTVLNMAAYQHGEVRLGFQVMGTESAFAAIDHVALTDQADQQVVLSLAATPAGKGEVYGEGVYIPGETITVEAIANVDHFFHFWYHDEDTLNWERVYTLLMPEEDHTLNALFSTEEPDVPTSANFLASENSEWMDVFPNPVAEHLTIRFHRDMGELTLSVISMDGRIMKRRSLDFAAKNGQLVLDVSDLPEGMYIVMAQNNTLNMLHRVAVAR